MITAPDKKRGAIMADLMPDMTPLLDVMFMLIVFFILTANAVPYAIDVSLPQDENAVTRSITDPDITSVTLLPGTQGWKINEASYKDKTRFQIDLRQKTAENKRVIIIGDKNVSMDKLLSLLSFLRAQNIEAADIVMERP